MKKFLSALFSLAVIAGICVGAYFHQQFVKTQINKVRGMYYVYKGDKAYKNLQMNKAIRLYNTGVKFFPGHYGAWYNLGNIYVEYEDYYSALYAYSQAFKYNPKMMVARMNYGVVATEKLGNFDAALEQFNKIIKTKRKMVSIPFIYSNRISSKANKAIAYYNIGVTYRLKSLYSSDDWELQRKYLAKAIEAYKNSLKIDSKNYDALYNLGIAYHISGRYSEAGECYCKAIEAQPMSYEAHFNLAVLLRRLRYYKESYDEIEKAATLVTALGQNSAAEQYVAIVMNDITKNLYGNEEYKSYLKSITANEKEKTKEHMLKDAKNMKETKKDKKNDTITSDGVNLVNGKVVVTKELDSSILKNFGKCPSMYIFKE